MNFSLRSTLPLIGWCLAALAFALPVQAESMLPQINASTNQIVNMSSTEQTSVTRGSPAPAVAPSQRSRRERSSATSNSAAYPYYIEFRSRYALSYGHTFLAHGRLSANGRILTQTIVGLHPAGDNSTPWTIGHVIPVPSEVGPSDGDLEEEYISARYRIDLTPEQYANVVAYVNRLAASSPMWHAVMYNCNAFVGNVAAYMGLRHGNSLEMPADYINGIRNMNGNIRHISTLTAVR